MITSLIELAEEMYATSKKKSLDSIDGGLISGILMEEYAIRLGHLIEEVGKVLYLQQEAIRIKEMKIRELTGGDDETNN
jgi:hypothetical protein